jgi:hypothetical protein
MLEIFGFDKKIVFNFFACRDLEKKLRREVGTTIFFGKITHVFGYPIKKGQEIHFLKEFFDFEEIFFGIFFWATKGGNDGRREQQNEGTTGMILPRPYSKNLVYAYALCI